LSLSLLMAPRQGNEPGSWELDASSPKVEGETRIRRSYCAKNELITRSSPSFLLSLMLPSSSRADLARRMDILFCRTCARDQHDVRHRLPCRLEPRRKGRLRLAPGREGHLGKEDGEEDGGRQGGRGGKGVEVLSARTIQLDLVRLLSPFFSRLLRGRPL
jgi:hypothetical protein